MKIYNKQDVRVNICWHWDPFATHAGGIERFIKDFIKYAPENFKFSLFALTKRKSRKFQTIELPIGGKNCDIIPVVADRSSGNRVIPRRMKYTAAIFNYTRLNQIKGCVFHYHGIESWLGVRDKMSNAHFLFLHKNPSYRWTLQSESKWRFMPPSLYKKLERHAICRIQAIFFVSKACFYSYRHQYPHLNNKMVPISTWVDGDTFYYPENTADIDKVVNDLNKELKLPRKAKVALYFGRFDEVKDPLLLLQSFNIISKNDENVYLIMVGSGKLKDKMLEQIRKLQIEDRARLLAPQPRKRIRELLWFSTLSVLASRGEGMSMSINESLACGRPVVGFDVGEIRSVVKPGISGEIIKERSSQAFAAGMAKVINKMPFSYTPKQCASCVSHLQPNKVLTPVFRETEKIFYNLNEQ